MNSRLFLKILKFIKELKLLICLTQIIIYLPKFKKYICIYRRNSKVMIHNILVLIYCFFYDCTYFFSSKLFLKIVKHINKFNTKCQFEVHFYSEKFIKI